MDTFQQATSTDTRDTRSNGITVKMIMPRCRIVPDLRCRSNFCFVHQGQALLSLSFSAHPIPKKHTQRLVWETAWESMENEARLPCLQQWYTVIEPPAPTLTLSSHIPHRRRKAKARLTAHRKRSPRKEKTQLIAGLEAWHTRAASRLAGPSSTSLS